MDVLKTDVGGSNRGPEAGPQRASGLTRGCQARQPNAPPRMDHRMCRNARKTAGKTGSLGPAHRQIDCLIPDHAYLDGHDGPFPLRKHLYGPAGELFRPRRTNARGLAEADQIEPGARNPSPPRSGPAW